jgi:hypothetical protein
MHSSSVCRKSPALIPVAPQVANLQTGWGISLFNHAMGIISHPFMCRFVCLVGRIAPAFGKSDWYLPDYDMGAVEKS